MSIATKRGDGGQTGLAGGIRVSKADLRVESYGSIDELNTVLGFARSICQNKEIAEWTETIQRTLFRVGSALATPPESKKQPPVVSTEDIDMLTDLVHKIEATEASSPTGRCPVLTPSPQRTKWLERCAAEQNVPPSASSKMAEWFNRRSFPTSTVSLTPSGSSVAS
jgi:cob(I)alamin adenosyltransferase